jgi:D-alanyl-D-alanine carboxypeptidase/D-alanyl-D-alanine-endopeptidase (penicillin-binding protein 4)
MMQESDNFIAEQLLMQCAFYMRGTFDSDSAIAVTQQMIMGGSPDPLQWVDGSGVSRYNLFSPRSIVWVLDQLRQLQSMDYLTKIFPAGGQSGTIAEWYKSNPPFVFAKTGTLRNNHSLSGYVRTDSGKWLIFSFMHNNFTMASAEIKTEMERVLVMVKGRY